MTKEQIQARIDTLTNEKQSVQQNLVATYDGAIQDCQYWLSQIETPVEPQTAEPTPTE